eukprot:tig00000202_g16618.t1
MAFAGLGVPCLGHGLAPQTRPADPPACCVPPAERPSSGAEHVRGQRIATVFGTSVGHRPVFGRQIRLGRSQQDADRESDAGLQPRCEAQRPPCGSYVVAGAISISRAEVAETPAPEPPNREVSLRQLVALLLLAQSDAERVSILEAQPAVRGFLARARRQAVRDFAQQLDVQHKLIFYSVIALGQGANMLAGSHRLRRGELMARLGDLVRALEPVQNFYADIGGVAGYHLKVLDLIAAHEGGVSHGGEDIAACPVQHGEEVAAAAALLSASGAGSGLLGRTSSTSAAGVEETVRFDAPPLVDLRSGAAAARLSPSWGIEHMSEICELYPLGGAGDRLGLVDPVTGASLPAACLPMQGRSMLEIMLRDLTGREYLYYKCFGEITPTPVAIMTSHEKDNHAHVTRMCEEADYFGRPRESFFFFTQPSVPAVTREGAWLFQRPVSLVTKPGGHGVVWRLAQQAGLFEWLAAQERTKALIRQINNPIAGVDALLLSLAGVGCRLNKSFGFAATERAKGASEGVNVLVERRVVDEEGSERHEYAVTCVEYTDFAKFGMADDAESLELPSNANLLFADLGVVEQLLRRPGAGHPGLTVNLSKPLKYTDEAGRAAEAAACRLESTMQSIADYIVEESEGPLPAGAERDERVPTFVLFDERRRVTSSAKKRFAPEKGAVMQTPERSFYDSLRNARELLADRCGVDMPEVPPFDEYVAGGLRPPFLVWYHPALGPTYEVIGQKVRGGRLAPGAELRLEVAELEARGLDLEGSLLVEAENVVGAPERPGGPVRMDDARAGRCTLRNVRVRNAGVRYDAPESCFWQARVTRGERALVRIRGNGEFHAEDVTLSGDVVYQVPDGCRVSVTAGPDGRPAVTTERLAGGPTWRWGYWIERGHVRVAREERGSPAFSAAEELRALTASLVARARPPRREPAASALGGRLRSRGAELSLASAAL